MLLWAYAPALHGHWLWDDDAHVTRASLRGWSGLGLIWFRPGATQQYYPVLHTAFWLEHHLWGDAVLGYHLITLIWHAAAAVMLMRCLAELGFERRTAGYGAVVWLLHPVAAESVAWISEQKNTLAAAGFFGAGWLYLRSVRAEEQHRASALTYSAATLVFLLALLSKTVVATLPVSLALVLWWRSRWRGRRDVPRLLPWLVAGAAAGVLTAYVERRYIGAQGATFDLAIAPRFALAGKVILFYLGKLIWPTGLVFIYPRWQLSRGFSLWLPSGVILAAAAVIAIQVGYRRGGRAPQPTWRAAATAALIFTGSLFPALGFVPVYPFLFSYVADHFQYLPAAVASAVFAWCGCRWLRASPAIWLAPAALAVLTHLQAAQYRDASTLYRETLARNPNAWLAHYNLAVIDQAHGDAAAAADEYRTTVRLNPQHWPAHNNLGVLLAARGDTPGAIAEYSAALSINPAFAEAHNNLGAVLARDPSRRQEAIAEFRAAIRLRPDYDAAHNDLAGVLLHQPGGVPSAISEYRIAASLAPDRPEYRFHLGNALATAGEVDAAVAAYRAALRLDPAFVAAHVNLASLLARRAASLPLAYQEYQLALAATPADAAIHFNYANALARDPARLAAAAVQYRAALSLQPRDAESHVYLAAVLIRQGGHRAEASQHLQAALMLAPGYTLARRMLERLPP